MPNTDSRITSAGRGSAHLVRQPLDDVKCLGGDSHARGSPFYLGAGLSGGRKPGITKGLDGGRDVIEAEDLERAAGLSPSAQVGIGHMDGTTGAATVVETISRGPDWDLGDGIVVKSGDWLVGMILEPKPWKLAKAGKLAGVSPQGTARRRRRAAAASPA